MCWHKWSKWEQYEKQLMRILKDGIARPIIETRERRICKKCGKMQDEYVSGV